MATKKSSKATDKPKGKLTPEQKLDQSIAKAKSINNVKPEVKKASKPVKKTKKSSKAQAPTLPPVQKIKWVERAISYANKHARLLAIASVIILILTTALWSYYGAKIQQSNADQLINSQLFETNYSFKNALLPGQHSFLLKWPFFFIVSAFGNSQVALIALTVGLSMVTVGALAWLIHRIEKRPLIFSAIILSLASVLLLVPAQPYAGGILPVNMAMLAGRNLEYVVYIGALLALLGARRRTERRVWYSLAALVALIASDKLFATLMIGGAFGGIILYSLFRRHRYTLTSLWWLAVGLLSFGLATGLLWLINVLGVVNIVNQSGTSPYAIAHGLHQWLLGTIYSVLAIFTNLGANPAFDATKLRDVPVFGFDRLFSLAGLGYFINGLVLVAGIICVILIFARSLSTKLKERTDETDNYNKLVIGIGLSFIVAWTAFIFTSHSYAVDARYLTIILPCLFLGIATYARRINPRHRYVIIWCAISFLAILSGSLGVHNNYQHDKQAMNNINIRNASIAAAVKQNHINLLVGDYWRVVPIKSQSQQGLTVIPLGDCTNPRNILSSIEWQKDLEHTSFAYLLSYDKGLTDFPKCSLKTIVDSYGRPNKSVVVAGTIENPTEVLLFYDGGKHHYQASSVARTNRPVTVVPGSLEEFPAPQCRSGHTIMNIVAHEDDDILFMNPDIQNMINQKFCVRTVYLTAGDAGSGNFYWLSREQGSQAAYNLMDGPIKDVWIDRIIKLANKQYVNIETPRNNPSISLIYLHLPDGNLQGQGFKGDNFESLMRLQTGRIANIHSVDGQSAYSDQELVNALATLMSYYKPDQINTQANDSTRLIHDHTDHIASGIYTTEAATLFGGGSLRIPVKYYMGYPVRELAPNLSETDITQKQQTFFEYAGFDGAVCGSVEGCSHNQTYNSFLQRQYQLGQ